VTIKNSPEVKTCQHYFVLQYQTSLKVRNYCGCSGPVFGDERSPDQAYRADEFKELEFLALLTFKQPLNLDAVKFASGHLYFFQHPQLFSSRYLQLNIDV